MRINYGQLQLIGFIMLAIMENPERDWEQELYGKQLEMELERGLLL